MSDTAVQKEDTVDLVHAMFKQLSAAAAESNWIPQEHYFVNDWVSDCCSFLRTGEGVREHSDEAPAH